MVRQQLLPSLVTTSAAPVQGITRARLRSPAYVRVAHGRYVPRGTVIDSPEARIGIVSEGLAPGLSIGGWAAARLHEVSARTQGDRLTVFDGVLPTMDRSDEPGLPVLVCAPRRSRAAVPEGAEVWRSDLRPDETVVIAGVRVTSALRTSFDLLRTWPEHAAVVGVDRLLNLGVVQAEHLAGVVAARSGWRGVPQARRALALVDARAESPRESMMRIVWLSTGLATPTANAVVRARTGQFVARVDLLDASAGVVAEYDGAFHAGVARRQADAARQEALEDLGLVVVRMTEADLATPTRRSAWQERLRSAYRRAADRPSRLWHAD